MLLRINNLESFVEAVSVAKFGTLTLHIAMYLALFLAAMVFVGMIRRDERLVHIARRSQYLLTLLLVLAAGVLYLMIFDGLYVSSYVFHITENQEVPFFKVTGLWASQQGSLLFWALVLSICGSIFAFTNRHSRTDRRFPPALLTLLVIEVFFIYLMMFDRSNPFNTVFEWMSYGHIQDLSVSDFLAQLQLSGFDTEGIDGTMLGAIRHALDLDVDGTLASMNMGHLYNTLSSSAETISQNLPSFFSDGIVRTFSDGKGMNPQLHNYWIAIHPPTLYLGYIGFTIPFCLAVGSLISGELDAEWIRRARLWTMASWTFLTAGIAMGGLWAYEILGWGGYWAWDPVENASFIPWLTATAFIHSVVVQERRGMLKVWNVALIILTYTLTIIGTFLVRSGIISSVHAFGDTGLITPLIVFMVTVFLGAILLIVWRMPLLRPDRKLRSVVSREGIFLINNLVLCLLAIGILTMTLWPVITKFLFGEEGRHEFAGEAYLLVNGPLFLILISMTALGPLLPYGKGAKREILRQLVWPLAFGIAAMAINVTYLLLSKSFIAVVDGQDAVSTLVTYVRIVMQITIPAIAVAIIATSVQEALSAGKLRRKATGGNIIGSTFDAVLANRRRFGGYICHIGVALVAVGIYVSSFYEVDASAQVPMGGYALIGDDQDTLAFVADESKDSELYRELRVMTMAENVLNNTANSTNGLDLWRSLYGSTAVTREALKMAQRLRVRPELTLESYLDESFAEIEHLASQSFARISDDARQRPFLMALQRFVGDPSLTPQRMIASMPNLTATNKMSESLELAYAVARSPAAMDYLEYYSKTEKDPSSKNFETSFAAFKAKDSGLLAPAWEKAKHLAKNELSHEYIASTVRIFEVNVSPVSDAEMSEYREYFGAARASYLETLQKSVGARVADASELKRAARLSAQEPAFRGFVDFGVKIGPAILKLLQREEEHSTSDLAQLRAFTNQVRDDIFAREAMLTESLVLAYGEGTRSLEEVAPHLAALGFRALGGLRKVQHLADQVDQDGKAIPPSAAEQKAIDFADQRIDEVLQGAYRLDPQIKVFYDKRTGKPRPMGEAVRDPQIERTLTRDLYVILQDVEIKESPFMQQEGATKDRFNYRIFVKPGMNLALAGLIIMILGAVFALLPTRRRAARAAVRIKSKAKKGQA